MKLNKGGYVYHIENPNYPNDLNYGYIGVTNENKGIYKRFLEHKKSKYPGHLIRNLQLNENNLKELFYGEIEDCFKLEAELRPIQNMGWNTAKGGFGCLYKSDITNLKQYRSDVQKQRMQNLEIKKAQGINFKINYYNNNESQKLRSKRAVEHMSIPEKRDKCLSALHKKSICNFCGYESNAGNVAQHIKRKHNETC